jgi:hypothetical protein
MPCPPALRGAWGRAVRRARPPAQPSAAALQRRRAGWLLSLSRPLCRPCPPAELYQRRSGSSAQQVEGLSAFQLRDALLAFGPLDKDWVVQVGAAGGGLCETGLLEGKLLLACALGLCGARLAGARGRLTLLGGRVPGGGRTIACRACALPPPPQLAHHTITCTHSSAHTSTHPPAAGQPRRGRVLAPQRRLPAGHQRPDPGLRLRRAAVGAGGAPRPCPAPAGSPGSLSHACFLQRTHLQASPPSAAQTPHPGADTAPARPPLRRSPSPWALSRPCRAGSPSTGTSGTWRSCWQPSRRKASLRTRPSSSAGPAAAAAP